MTKYQYQMSNWDQEIRGQWAQSRSFEGNVWGSEENRKSRIHKIPFNKQVNLGNQPEVVILLQAAEIQRLNKLLSIHKNESKLYGKQHLDRHSYEIQIRELTSLVDSLTKKNENLNILNEQHKKKVKECQEIENSKAVQEQYRKLANKYERALLQIGKMYDDNTKLQDELNVIYQQMEQNYSKENHKQTQQQNQLISKRILQQMQFKHSQQITNLRRQLESEMKSYRILMGRRNDIDKQSLKQELQRQKNQNNILRSQLDSLKKEYSIVAQLKNENQKKIRQLSMKLAQSQNKVIHKSKESMRATLTQSNYKSLSNEHIIKLQNQIALLSQQLERLTFLVDQKNLMIQKLREKESALSSIASQTEIKLKRNQQKLRVEREKVENIQNRYKQQVNTLKKKIKEAQDTYLLIKIELEQKISQARQQERKQYEKRFQNERVLMQYESSFEKNQVERLKSSVSALKKQIQEYESREKKYLNEKSRDQYSTRQNLREQQRKYELRISELERYINQMEMKIESDMKEQKKREIQKLYAQINQLTQNYRERQIQSASRMKNLIRDHENKLMLIELQQNSKIQTLQSVISQKNRQILNQRHNFEYREEQNQFSFKSHIENLNSKLDYIDGGLTKLTSSIESLENIIKDQPSYFQKSTGIDYLIKQISSLAGQIAQLSLNSQGKSPLVSYYQEYIRQLQTQNESYLRLINEKVHNNNSMINKIWDRIDFNQQEQRQQWRKWLQNLKKQQKLIEKVIQEKEQDTRNRIEKQKERAGKEYEKILIIQQLEMKNTRLDNDAKYWKGLYEKKQQDCQTLEGQLSKVSQKLFSKQKEYKISMDSLIERTEVQKSVFTQFRQQDKLDLDKKDQIIHELNYQIQSLSAKIVNTTKQAERAEEGMIKLLSQAKNDLANLQQMESQNVDLRKKIKLAYKQIEETKLQYDNFISHIWTKINELTESICRKGTKNQNGNENSFVDSEVHGIQISLINLENALKKTKKDLFWLNHQTYEQNIDKHVSKEFSLIKLTQLNRQIDRLSDENIQLKEEIQRYKLQFISQSTKKSRIEQNLALMVLLFAEIDSLRSRLRQNVY